MKLEIGKHYTCLDGSTTGPIAASHDEAYPFRDARGLVYAATGKRPQGVDRCYEITGPLDTRPRIEELTAALAEAIAFIQAGFPELEDEDETITTSSDEGPEATFHYAAALRLLSN